VIYDDFETYLITKGYASPEQIAEARGWQRTTGGDFYQILVGRGVNSRDVYLAKAVVLNVPFVDLTIYQPHSDAIDAIPEHIAKRHNVLPIKKDGNTLYVAMSDLNNITANDAIRLACRCLVRGVLADPDEIRLAIQRHYAVQ
jgi:type IV pilus assembly protein PilB